MTKMACGFFAQFCCASCSCAFYFCDWAIAVSQTLCTGGIKCLNWPVSQLKNRRPESWRKLKKQWVRTDANKTSKIFGTSLWWELLRNNEHFNDMPLVDVCGKRACEVPCSDENPGNQMIPWEASPGTSQKTASTRRL
jgi:hypothetical protein